MRRELKCKPSGVQMVDASTEIEKCYLDMFHIPVKAKPPSPSEPKVEKLNDRLRLFKINYTLIPRTRAICVKPITITSEKKNNLNRIGITRRGRPSKIKASGRGPLFCGLCDFRAKNVREQKAHKKSHSNENLFECDHCKSTFSQKGNLLTHIRTHTNEKPFKCDECDFAASQKINLLVHFRKHTKEKPFKCDYCDFKTAQQCNLIAHVGRKHPEAEVVKTSKSGKKEKNEEFEVNYYKCELCKFSCSLKKQIIKHVKLHQ